MTSIVDRTCRHSGPWTIAGRAAVVSGVIAIAAPAHAIDGPGLLDRVCARTMPDFRNAAAEAVALGAVPVEVENDFLQAIEPASSSAFELSDTPGTDARRFLLIVSHGRLASRPASSCGIADKVGFTLADMRGLFPPDELADRSGEVLYTKSIDLVTHRPGGAPFWIVLRRSSFDRSSGDARRLSMATIVTSDFLDQFMPKVH